uniref:TRAF3-interacting protein 1 C-terminal domain-containing protein n=1 Tax=Anopheles maculatus TaxID=74869 RepID=A0A182SJI9_9DIPT
MAFLQKLIDVVKLTTDRELKVRPSKIVAGLEPERTNELLQALATALENKLNTNDIVRQYLGDNSKPNGSGNEVPETNGTVTKQETREENKKAGKQEKSKEKTREKETILSDKRKDKSSKAVGKEKDVVRNGATVQQQVESRAEKGKTKQNGTKVSNDANKKKNDKSGKGKEKEKTLKRISSIPEEQHPVAVVPEKTAPITNGSEITVANGTMHENRKRKDSLKEFGEPVTLPDANGEESNAVPSADEDHEKRKQPGSNSSSRRSSLKKQNSLTPSENNALSEMNQFNGLHSSLSRQDSNSTVVVGPDTLEEAAPTDAPNRTPAEITPNETQKLGEINVKMEVFNSELLDDDGENLIVIEDPSTATDEIVYGRVTTDPSRGVVTEEMARLPPTEQEEQQGHLVQQILETQKEFSSHTGTTDSEMLRKADMEWTAGQRQSSAKQMESLRDSIQKLTRSVNPLGKLMDFIQEDIDSMERELASWQQIYTQSMVELNKERR